MDAGIVENPLVPQDVEGPEGLLCDGKVGGTVATDSFPCEILNQVDGMLQLSTKAFRRQV